ncbi:MAG: carboxypeptidase M32 [Deltaproteobacteria bacterium]|nr:carboxypeptidase M32 [Deltaproteobacteria bacterium]
MDHGGAQQAQLEQVRGALAALETLEGISGLLEWDQQTMMPAGGGEVRGAQLALMARLQHERLADPALGGALEALADQLGPPPAAPSMADVDAVMVARALHKHHRAVRVPTALVGALAEAKNAGFRAWVAAREARDFSMFAPALRRLVDLSRERAAALGGGAHPYDALLEDFDAGATVAQLQPLLVGLGDQLAPRVAAAAQAGPGPRLHLPAPALARLHAQVLEAMGWDGERGRLDQSIHPFSLGIHPGDVRITTHTDPDDPLGCLSSTMHEAGHGLYEQGLPLRLSGTGLRAAAGTALHESQSRFWENVIGRSEAFFEWLAPRWAAEHAAAGAPGPAPSAAALYAAANRVSPSLIRVHADETTYNLHIIVRFELELGLFSGALPIEALPEAWDAAYQARLGLRPAHATEGVLQDVHWCSGYFGYFPSYTLGNLMAAGFRAALEAARPALWAEVGRGELQPTLAWLRENVHQHGNLLTTQQVLDRAIGPRDLVADLLAHLDGRGLAAARAQA